MNTPLSQYWAVLAPHFSRQWRKVALLAVLLFATTGLQLVNPQLLRRFIDGALAASGGPGGLSGASAAGDTARVLATTALLYLAAGLANQLLSALATYVSSDVGWRATNRLREDLALHCLRLDLSFHNARTPGELIERIDGDVNALANFFSAFVVRVLGSVLLVIGVLVMLAREDWRVGAALAVFALLVFVALERSRGVAVPAAAAEREASAQLYGFLEERLAGIDDVRANGAGAYAMHRFFERGRNLFHRGRRAWLFRGVLWTLTIALFGVGNVISLALGIRLFQAGAITIGTVYLFTAYIELLLNPLEKLVNQLQDLQQASAGIARIQELYQARSAITDSGAAPPALAAGALAVAFDGVSFRYPDAAVRTAAGPRFAPLPEEVAAGGADSDAVLADVSFRLEAGQVLGLLGRTGSGKTTCAKLLFRLYDPTAGAIRLGGVDLRALRLADVRRRVTMVTQDVQLFRGTVRDNLTLFDDGVEDARILAVLDELGLAEWLRMLPRGLDTLLADSRPGASGAAGDDGARGLSAGEAQLLAFTRAFLGDPAVVILDEASSRLDRATEQLIERAVARLLRGRTGVIIAHRLATVQRADQLLILNDGRIQEYGAREALARDPASRFAALLRAGLETEAETLLGGQRAAHAVDEDREREREGVLA